MGWVGVDLDDTLAEYQPGYAQRCKIGAPVAPMVRAIQQHIADGYEVRIFTARVSGANRPGNDVARQRAAIETWCKQHIGKVLPVTCEKDYQMIFVYDDRCVAVEAGTGRLLSPVRQLRPLTKKT